MESHRNIQCTCISQRVDLVLNQYIQKKYTQHLNAIMFRNKDRRLCMRWDIRKLENRSLTV